MDNVAFITIIIWNYRMKHFAIYTMIYTLHNYNNCSIIPIMPTKIYNKIIIIVNHNHPVTLRLV